MAVGVRIRDPSTGAALVTIDTHLTKVLGTFNTGTTDGSLSAPALANGTPFFTTTPSVDGSGGSIPPTIVATSNGLSWSWQNNPGAGYRLSVDVTYGFWT